MNVAAALPPKDHNRPKIEDDVKDRLARDYAATIKGVSDLAARADEMPKEILNDDDAATVSDFIRNDVAASIKAIEGVRVAEKEPFLQSGRAVDGFFKPQDDRLQRIKRVLEDRVGVYLTKKAREERERREAEARRMREEAAARLREAEEAAERERQAKAAAEAAPSTVTRFETTSATRDANAAISDAFSADNAAVRAERQAEAKPADLARTRSAAGGSLATLKEEWDFEIIDRDQIPLEVLRPHIPLDAFEKAVRAFVKVGNRSLEGVRIFKVERAVIR